MDVTDNELLYMESIHLFVEVRSCNDPLDDDSWKRYGHDTLNELVCEVIVVCAQSLVAGIQHVHEIGFSSIHLFFRFWIIILATSVNWILFLDSTKCTVSSTSLSSVEKYRKLAKE